MSLQEQLMVREFSIEENKTIYRTAYGLNNEVFEEKHPSIEYYFRAPSLHSEKITVQPKANAPAKGPAPSKKPVPAYNCCPCYDRDSEDARCCGICYKCCPVKDNETRCDWCLNDLDEYCKSGMVYTDSGMPRNGDNSDDDCNVFCVVCLPIKFSFFFSCCLGSCFNGCINACRDTNTNYLF
jgi:hypothetical protein